MSYSLPANGAATVWTDDGGDTGLRQRDPIWIVDIDDESSAGGRGLFSPAIGAMIAPVRRSEISNQISQDEMRN
jgi:hypothetical protein